MESIDGEKYKELFKQIGELQNLFQTTHLDHQSILDSWTKHQANLSGFTADLDTFKQNGCKSSQQFEYWNTFLDEIAPVLRDLTRSNREADWKLHISAVRRALPLCFTFDRVNYKRWLPIYYEDCIALPQNFPIIYTSFAEGGFVVKHTNRCGSSVPMDQALEKAYNKPAKDQAGIIELHIERKQFVNGILSNMTRSSLLISYTNCAHSTMMKNTLCTMNFQNQLLMLMNIVSTKLSIMLVSEEILLKQELTSL